MSNVPDFFNPNEHNQHPKLQSESNFCLRTQLGFLINRHGFATVVDTITMIIQDVQPASKSLVELENAVRKIESEGF